ncbi:MAG: hypothetical protein ABJC39_11930, partial [Chloroflexota bacterium]
MQDEPPTDASDPGDLTQRHVIPPADPTPGLNVPVHPITSGAAPDPATPAVQGWTPDSAAIEPGGPAVDRYTPSPEPRADWSRSWEATAPATPERWYEPAPTPAIVSAATPESGRNGRGGGGLLAVALLSAVLASGGTVLALGAAGALDRPTPASSAGAQATNTGAVQPLAIDESSATIAVASKVSPAVVRITVTGSSGAGNLGVIPPTGVGSGVIFDSHGWILTNHHVVEG